MHLRLNLSASLFCGILFVFAPFLAESSQISTGVEEGSDLDGSLSLETRYDYNVYYDLNNPVSDTVVALRPKVWGQTKPSSFYLKGEVAGLYENFLSQNIQNHFDYSGRVTAKAFEGRPFSILLGGGYKTFSDPSPDSTYGRLPRTVIDGKLETKIKRDSGSSIDLKAYFEMEDFVNTKFTNSTYLSNTTAGGSIQYNDAFLPETYWFLRGGGGFRSFPNGEPDFTPKDFLIAKNNSFYGLAEAGIVGRLTEKSVIDCATGWLVRAYDAVEDEGENFSGPVFYFRFTEQITRKDQLAAGYNYVVKDSYLTNFYLDQEVYLGLARVIGDQVLLMGRVNYSYRNYSLPIRRDDQRIFGTISARYSLTPSIKITARMTFDFLNSDSYDNSIESSTSIVPTNPDRQASYRAGSFGLGIMAAF